MQFYLLIQLILLINNSVQDNHLASEDEFSKINRITKKLSLIEEETINQNQLIDALEQDTFLPHRTLGWSTLNSKTSKLTTKNNKLEIDTTANLKHSNELDEEIDENNQKVNENDKIHNHHNLHHKATEKLINNLEEPSKTTYIFNLKTTRKKLWKKRNSKLIDKKEEEEAKQTTSAMPYLTSSTLENALNKDTTRYTINTYSSVSYNPSHHHLQYKQINIKQDNSTILSSLLPSTFSLSRFDDYSSTTKENKFNKFNNFKSKDIKSNDYNENTKEPMTTPISIDKSIDKSSLSKSTEFNLDLLEHRQLLTASSLGELTRSLLESRGKNKAKNQIELRLNKSEVIKINWPIKKIVDLAGDISLGKMN